MNNCTSDVLRLSKFVHQGMQDFQEIIVLQRLGLEYLNPTDDLEIQIPGLTNDMKRLELNLKEGELNYTDNIITITWFYLN